jgi:hypothetical protein
MINECVFLTPSGMGRVGKRLQSMSGAALFI